MTEFENMDVLEEIKHPRFNWWGERYPKQYPCGVELWRHFEGGMFSLSVTYNIEHLQGGCPNA